MLWYLRYFIPLLKQKTSDYTTKNLMIDFRNMIVKSQIKFVYPFILNFHLSRKNCNNLKQNFKIHQYLSVSKKNI